MPDTVTQLNLDEDSHRVGNEFDTLAVDNPREAKIEIDEKTQEDTCMQKEGYSASINLYLSAKALYIERIPFRILQSAVETDVEALEVELNSNYPCCFQLAVGANVLVTEFEVFLDGGNDLSKIDQNIVEDTGLVRILARFCSKEILDKSDDGSGRLACLWDI